MREHFDLLDADFLELERSLGPTVCAHQSPKMTRKWPSKAAIAANTAPSGLCASFPQPSDQAANGLELVSRQGFEAVLFLTGLRRSIDPLFALPGFRLSITTNPTTKLGKAVTIVTTQSRHPVALTLPR